MGTPDNSGVPGQGFRARINLQKGPCHPVEIGGNSPSMNLIKKQSPACVRSVPKGNLAAAIMGTRTRHWLGLVLACFFAGAAWVPAQGTEVILFSLTNSWRYNQTTSYDGTNWTAPGFNDSLLPSGRGVLGLEDASNPFVIARTNTVLTLGRTTYYFRTHFAFAGNSNGVMLTFSNIVDDGAVFYLAHRGPRRGRARAGRSPARVLRARPRTHRRRRGPCR